MHKEFQFPALPIVLESLIAEPKNHLVKICQFLNITCSTSYMNDVEKGLFKAPSRTRRGVDWTETQKDRVENIKNIYSSIFREKTSINWYFMSNFLNLKSIYFICLVLFNDRSFYIEHLLFHFSKLSICNAI